MPLTHPEHVPATNDDATRVIFLMARMSPPTWGHIYLIKQMLSIGDFAILVLTPGYMEKERDEIKMYPFFNKPFSSADREKMIRMRLTQDENARLFFSPNKKTVTTALNDNIPMPHIYQPSEEDLESLQALSQADMTLGEYIKMVSGANEIESIYMTAGEEYEYRTTGYYDENGQWVLTNENVKRYMGADKVISIDRLEGIAGREVMEFLVQHSASEELSDEDVDKLKQMFFRFPEEENPEAIQKLIQFVSSSDDETPGLFRSIEDIRQRQDMSQEEMQEAFQQYLERKDEEARKQMEKVIDNNKESMTNTKIIQLASYLDKKQRYALSDFVLRKMIL